MSSITFDCIDNAKRLKTLNVNKSEGPDDIHPRVLSEISNVLAYPLTLICLKSFSSSKLLLDWRSGNITTIFRNGSRLDTSNYRPVSITCICCKIMESIIRNYITTHLFNNKCSAINNWDLLKVDLQFWSYSKFNVI